MLHDISIDLKGILSNDTWDALIDVCAIRNMLVHNNGRIDKQFKSTATYERLKDKVQGELLILDQKMIQNYYREMVNSVITISALFKEKYNLLKRDMIVIKCLKTNC